MSRLGLIWRTVRHLRFQQLYYQVVKQFRGRAKLRFPKRVPAGYFLQVPQADKPVSYAGRRFTFLNQPIEFDEAIDWNCGLKGKLWTYNLTYFDFLNQPTITIEEGLSLIREFIAQTNSINDGLEPYPTSLRIINWIQFLSRHEITDEPINRHLAAQIDLVNRRLEYHLAGNHLLENGFALLTGGLFFRDQNWFYRATKLIRQELTVQILADGAHHERSPMYHQIVLDRLLDAILALRGNNWYDDDTLVSFMSEKAVRMLCWLNSITFSNGDVPLVNDASQNIAPTTAQIRKKALQLLPSYSVPTPGKGIDSGYRMFRRQFYELFIDVGAVGPDHQPGHAHADTFSFVLYVNGQPVIIDPGVTTYEIGVRRSWERSTAAHNTVSVMGENSSEVWSGFRVGRRAHVMLQDDTVDRLSACHDGYGFIGISHERSWYINSNRISVFDRLVSDRKRHGASISGIARLYFHPAIAVTKTNDSVRAGPVEVTFISENVPTLSLTSYPMSEGFNQVRIGHCLEIAFEKYLNTTVTIDE
ncbi:alginate lyase family protein [Spirosoma sp. SC4-14]|uniref:alginate lyase family protein n=1 Tax=Spirosoma sp. SC4-14 TaxID=3128900 RepID=UPI0030CF9BCB